MKDELRAAYDAAHLKTEWLTIKNVCLSRDTQTLTVTAERKANLVSEQSVCAWETAIRSLLSAYTVSFVYHDVEPERIVQKPVPQKKNEVDVPLPENGVLLGKPIPEGEENVSIFELNGEEETAAVFTGRLVAAEIRDDWSMRVKKPNCRVLFNVTDLNDSIYCTASFPEEWQAARFLHWLSETAKSGKDLRVKGVCRIVKKTGERSVYTDAVGVLPRALRSDDAEEKRVELHLHSRMSTMDGITNLTEAFRTAKRWGHKALAITDHGVVQAFPEAAKAAKATGVKAIFGVEAYLIPDCESIPTEGDFTVFDIETTGLKADRCDIIEIGAVRLHDGQVVGRFQSFIDDGIVIPKEITELTGITQFMIEGAPSTREVLDRFRAFAEDSTLVAHNAAFDTGFITRHGDRFGIMFLMPYADTLMLSRYLLRDALENHKLNTVADYLHVDMGSHHRADDDANTCAEILLHFIDMLKGRGIDRIPVVPNTHDAYLKHASKEKRTTNHIILLAKTQKGMKDLYKLVSWAHLDYLHVRPQIPKSLLMLYRSDLIVGSACEAGELFRAILNGEPQDTIEKIAAFYDYFEIQPIGNNAFLKREGRVKDDDGLRELNRRIVELGERMQKPVAATGDVHFLEPTDAIYRAILMSKQGFEDAEQQAPLYLKPTREMLDEFSYLGEQKAREVVVDVPNRIADLCGELVPFPDGTHSPTIENAEEELKNTAIDRAHEIYGDPLPPIVQARLDKELNSIIGNHYASLYLMAQRLVKKSLSDGYLVGSRGSVGSSVVAMLAGITEVNALSPHYVCPNCKFSDFDVDRTKYSVGADMPNRACPKCGAMLKKEGFEIPFEVFLGFKGDKVPDIDLNFSGEYQPVAHKYVEEMFGKGHAFRAGTISGLAERKAFECVYSFAEATGRTFSSAEVQRLEKGCEGVKVTTGQHPGGIVIVPRDNDEYTEVYDYTPIQYPADKVDKDTITTHFDFHAMDDRLVKLDILGHDDPTALHMLENLTGLNPRTIPLDDPETRALFSTVEPLGIDLTEIGCSLGTLGVPEFGTGFVRQVLENTRPTTFEELIRIAGLTHGTDVWLNNAEPLVMGGIAKLSEVLCTRDDIMNYLIAHGMEASLSFKIMERVRKGKGLTDEMEQAMTDGAIPAWFIDSCKKIKYMFPRGHAVAYSMSSFRIAYYKVHYPLAFYAVYFTVRADTFDILRAAGGPEAVKRQIDEIEKDNTQKTDSEKKKDKELVTILELVYEMNLRGIELLPVDIYKSDATKFLIEGNALRPPFDAVPGVGAGQAIAICERRKPGVRYPTIEDFANETGANSAIVSMLEQCGAFGEMPKNKQISLFDL